MSEGYHRGNKPTTKESSILGGEYAVDQIMFDYLREPKIVCEYNKRRKCDSYYVARNRALQQKIIKARLKIIALKGDNKDLDEVLKILDI